MSAFAIAQVPHHGELELSAGLSNQYGWEARARAGYAINSWLAAGAEVYAQSDGLLTVDAGALATLTAHF